MLDNESGIPALFHRSSVIWRKSADNSSLPMYHRQNSYSTTLLGHLKCIADHDAYRDRLQAAEAKPTKKNPANALPWAHSKKGKKLAKQQKKQKKRREVKRVLTLIEELEAAEDHAN